MKAFTPRPQRDSRPNLTPLDCSLWLLSAFFKSVFYKGEFMNGNKTHGIGPGGLKCPCCLPGHWGWSRRDKVKKLLAKRVRREVKLVLKTQGEHS
jgi:hypothetical protein